MKETVLEMRNICKQFGGIQALNDVTLTLERGEVLCLCGENGAGKSTLMKILARFTCDESRCISTNHWTPIKWESALSIRSWFRFRI